MPTPRGSLPKLSGTLRECASRSIRSRTEDPFAGPGCTKGTYIFLS